MGNVLWVAGGGNSSCRLNWFAARCSLRGKLREIFYGLRSVKTVLADLTGLPSVAVCCGKLRENVSVGECCSGEWYAPVQA